MQRRSFLLPAILTLVGLYLLLNVMHIGLSGPNPMLYGNAFADQVERWATEDAQRQSRETPTPVTAQALSDKVGRDHRLGLGNFAPRSAAINPNAAAATDDLVVFRNRSGLHWQDDIVRVSTIGNATFEPAPETPLQIAFAGTGAIVGIAFGLIWRHIPRRTPRATIPTGFEPVFPSDHSRDH